jgi:response regulator RpfG family c-di-GMP phosphodiesterase
MPNETILLVDDEVKVLSSLTRSLLEEDFGEIKTAQNGLEALGIIKKIPNLAVIVSDYHMPGINGIDFLAQVCSLSPDTTCILLTGAADLEMAVDAVNRGNLFRFLIKPCSSEVFITAVKDGIRQNQLITGERELLSKTLNGSIKVMIDILSVLNPDIFAKASRLRNLGRDLASALGIPEQSWEIELAALLCQVGAVTIPRNILLKWQTGGVLDDSERDMVKTIPRMGKQLIKNIPRLENIANAVGYQDCTYTRRISADAPTGENIPLIARILKIVVDFDRFKDNAYKTPAAFQAMLKRESEYDPHILDIFGKKVLRIETQLTGKLGNAKLGEKEIYVEDLKLGMVLTRDIIDKNRILIVAKDTIITEVLMYKLINYFRSQSLIEPVFIETGL